MADTLQVLDPDRWGRVSVERRAGVKLISRDASVFATDRDYTRAAVVLGVQKAVLLDAIDRYRTDPRDNLTSLG